MNTFEDEANDVLVNAVYAEKSLFNMVIDTVRTIIMLIKA